MSDASHGSGGSVASVLDPDWSRFRPESAPILTVEPFGRASTIFFQGLLDGHPELLVLPWDATPLFNKRGEKRDPDSIAHHLDGILTRAATEYGPPDLSLDRERFRATVRAVLDQCGVHWGSEVVATFLGYAAAAGRPLSEVRYLCVAAHGHPRLSYMLSHFPNWRAVFLSRDPRGSFASMKKRKDLDLLAQQANFAAFHRVMYRGLLAGHPDQVLSMRHEDLHTDWPSERARLLEFIELDDHPALERSSYFGWPYTGEGRYYGSTADLYESEPDPRYVTDSWKDSLSAPELRAVQESSSALMDEFGYPPETAADLRGRSASANYLSFLARRAPNGVKRAAELLGGFAPIREMVARSLLPRKLARDRIEREQLFERVLEEIPNPSDAHVIPGFRLPGPPWRARLRRVRNETLSGPWIPVLFSAGLATWALLGGLATAETALVTGQRSAAAAGFAFLLAFGSRPLRKRWKHPLTLWLRNQRRRIGVACGALLGFHLVALAAHQGAGWQAGGLAWATLAATTLAVGAMTVTSNDAAARRLGAGRWKRLHRFGGYVACAGALAAFSPLAGAPWGPRPLLFVAFVGLVALRTVVALQKKQGKKS